MSFLGAAGARAIPWLARGAAGGSAGLGIGYASDNDDYTLGEGFLDAGLGMFGAVGPKLAGMGLGALAPKASAIPRIGGFTSKGLQRGADSKLGRYSLIGGPAFASTTGMGEPDNGGFLDSLGPIGSALGLGASALEMLGRGAQPQEPVNPVLEGGMFGGFGGPGSFNKTFADYLNDPTLNEFANKQIITENQALIRANQVIQRQRNREVEAQNDAGQNAIDRIGQVRRENVAQNEAISDNADAARVEALAQADELAENVGLYGINDDHTAAELEASRVADQDARAARSAADAKLLSRMANAGQNALSEISAAEAMNTKANVGAIRENAAEQLVQNRVQAKDNWGKKSGIVGSLAQSNWEGDMQAHNMGLQQWNAKLQALNAWRSTLMEDQKLKSQGTDPEILRLMWDMANTSTRFTEKGTNSEGGEWSYTAPVWEGMDPRASQAIGQQLSPVFGGANPFSQPFQRPSDKEDKWGFWR